MIAGAIGVAGAVALGILAFITRSIWTGLIAFFLFSQSAAAVQRAKEMAQQVDLQTRSTSTPEEAPEI